MVFIHLPRHDLTTRAKDLYNDAHEGRPQNILASHRNNYLGDILDKPLTVSRETALHIAVTQNNERTAENLLLIGADPNKQTTGMETPLLISTRMNTVKTTRNLLMAGGDPNIPDIIGVTSMHWVARHGTLDMMQEMIAAGGSVTTKTNRDETPLHWATNNRDPRIAMFLVQAGADPTAKMIDGNDAAACANARMHPELSAWLKDAKPGQKTPGLPEVSVTQPAITDLQKWRQGNKKTIAFTHRS